MAFANGKPLDPINDALRKVIDDIQSDKDLKEFYDQVAEEFNRLLTEKGYVISDAADARVHQLYERSQELLHEKQDSYRPDVEHFFAEVRSFIDAIRNDKESQRLVEASKKVYSDLVITDRYGNFRGFRKRIFWDMIEVIFPRFVDEIKFVPVPRIEYQDRDFDLILENVVLESGIPFPFPTWPQRSNRSRTLPSHPHYPRSLYPPRAHKHLHHLKQPQNHNAPTHRFNQPLHSRRILHNP